MSDTSHHYSLDFEPNYVFVNGEALLKKHWSFTGPTPNGQLDITFDLPKGATLWAGRLNRHGGGVLRPLDESRIPHTWSAAAAAMMGDERENSEQRKSCAVVVTRCVEHCTEAGFTLEQVHAMVGLFSAMIDSHEANRGTK